MADQSVTVSVIIPAYNEAAYLPRYLPTVQLALKEWEKATGLAGEVIVVDNDSSDLTAAVAQNLGVQVVTESGRGIGLVRNAGAAKAAGRFLFFIDADVAVPAEYFLKAVPFLQAGAAGGAAQPVYRCKRLGARLLCAFWDWRREQTGGAQGVAQFCPANVFWAIGGYRTDLFMSEDFDFFARLCVYGEETGQPVSVLRNLIVEPSTRRYDTWPTWRMLLWQNPVTARMKLTSPRFWRHWYQDTVR